MAEKNVLFLKNPHSVLAALQTRPHDVLELHLPPKLLASAVHSKRGGVGQEKNEGEGSSSELGPWVKVMQAARPLKIPLQASESALAAGGLKNPLGRRAAQAGRRSEGGSGSFAHSPPESGRGGGSGAKVRPKPSLSIEEFFAARPSELGGRFGTWLALDRLQDPQNIGALFRSAAFFGVRGVILTQDHSAAMTAAVYDVAAGGVEWVPHTLQVNLARALEMAKKAGLWIMGATEHAPQSFGSVPRDRAWLLILGNEEKGMRRLTEESCDSLVQITGQGSGSVSSLNVSVAGAVLMQWLTADNARPV